MMSKVFSKSPTIAHTGRGNSSRVVSPVGSGSRPGGSKMKTPTSAPSNPKTLGRSGKP